MKVLHVQKARGVSGSERHLLELLPGLGSRGVEVTMCVLGAPGAERFVDVLAERDIETVTIPPGQDVNPILLRRLHHLIRRLRPSLVHTHLIHGDVHGQPAARLAGVPGVLSLHGTHAFYRREPFRFAARMAGRLAQRTIAISEYAARFAQDTSLAPAGRIRVVPYGIDVDVWSGEQISRADARASFGLSPKEVAVGIASRLVPHKGHDFLLRGVAHARRSGAKLTLLVAGDGPERASLETLANRMLPPGSVRFLGFVSDVPAFMQACDVVAFPSLPQFGEGFGLAALEAMAASRPVVATRVASLPEIVVDGETGLLVEPDDVDGLAAALTQPAADPDLRAVMGSRARERATTVFSIDAMVDRTVAVYEEVLAERRRTGMARGA